MSDTTAQALVDPPTQALPLTRELAAGAISGQIAGLVMAVVVMLVFVLFLGTGPLYPVQVIGGFIFGDAALEGFHLPAVVAGLLLHQLGPALFWGLVFGAVVSWRSITSQSGLLATGVAVGILSQVIDAHLILPPLMNVLHGHDIWAEQVPVLWSWAAHLVFGLALVVHPRVRAWLTRFTDRPTIR